MNKKYLKYFLITSILIGFSSCRIKKDYVAPQIEDVSIYRNSISTDSINFANSSWWEIFNDTTLVSLIDEGLSNNFTFKKHR